MARKLQPQVVHIPVGGGRRGDVDEAIIQPPEMRAVHNMEFDKSGRARVRHDYFQLGVTGKPASGKPAAFFDHNGELTYRYHSDVVRYSTQAGEHVSPAVPPVPPTEISAASVYRGQKNIVDVDMARSVGDYRYYIWRYEGATTLYYTVEDGSGVLIHGPSILSGVADEAWIVPLGTTIVVVGRDSGTSTTLVSQAVSQGNAPGASWTTLATGVVNADLTAQTSDATKCFLVTQTSTFHAIYELNTSAAIVQSYNDSTPVGDLKSCYWNTTTGRVYAVLENTTNGNVQVSYIPTTFTSWSASVVAITPNASHGTYAATTLELHNAFIGELDSSGGMWALATYYHTGAGDWGGTADARRVFSIQWSSIDATGLATGTRGDLWHYRIYSRPFYDANSGTGGGLVGAVFQGVEESSLTLMWDGPPTNRDTAPARFFNSSLQRYQCVLRRTFETVSGTTYPRLTEIARLYSFAAEDYAHADAVIAGDVKKHRVRNVWLNAISNYFESACNPEVTADGVVSKTSTGLSGNPVRCGLDFWRITLQDTRHTTATARKLSLLDGGVLDSYDGDFPRPNNVPYYPQITGVTRTGTAAAWAGGDHKYRFTCVYKYVDSAGQAHRSAPSIVMTHDLNNSETWATLNLEVTCAPALLGVTDGNTSLVYIEVYAGQDGGLHHKVHEQQCALNEPLVLVNIPRSSLADSATGDVPAGPVIYTDGGILEAGAAPGFSAVAVSNNRVWGIAADNPHKVFASKQFEDGVAPEFALEQFLLNPSDGAGYVAIAELDDKTVLFGRGRIDVVYGDGPGPDGVGSFVGPQNVAKNIGCVSKHSVVSTIVGVFFQAASGIHLLGRDMNVSFIGAPVEDVVLDGYNDVVSATEHPRKKQVRFLLDNGTMCVFDYEHGQWCTFAIPGVGTLWGVTTWNRDGDSYNAIISDDLDLYYEDESTDHDPTEAAKTAYFETGWINVAGIHGYARVKEIALSGTHSTGSLQIDVFYNHVNSIVDTYNFTQAELNDSDVDVCTIKLGRPKCKAFKLKVSTYRDTALSESTGAGSTINGITIEVGVKAGVFSHMSPSKRK